MKIQNNYNNKINLFFSILFFILLQLAIIDYIFFQILYTSYFIYVFFIMFLISIAFFFYKINIYYMLSLPFLFIIGFISYLYPGNIYILLVYVFFAAFIFYVYRKTYITPKSYYEPNMYILLFFLLFAVFSLLLLSYVNESLIIIDRKTIEWYLCFRGSNQHINLVFHGPFKDWQRLIIPVLFFFIILSINFMIIKNIVKREIYLLIILIVITFSAKFITAYLSDKGLDVIKQKIENRFNCSYYYFANEYRDNIYDFIKDYTKIHQKEKHNAHIKGHPVLPVLFYWLVNKFISPSPYITGIIVAFLASLSVIPIFFIIKLLIKSSTIAYLGGLFYGLSANSTILSLAGIDSIIVLFFALTIFFYLSGLENNKWYLFIFSGISFGVNSWLTFGLWHIIPIMLLYYFIFPINIKKNINMALLKDFLIMCFYFAGGILICFFIFYLITKGKFDYLASFNIAKSVHNEIIFYRPYELWVWLNFIHWSLYISIPMIALYLYRYILALTGKIRMDSFSLFSLIIMLTQFISCTSRAETHRIWMFLIILIVPVSIMVLINKQSKVNPVFINLFTGLIYINSILIELLITDAH